MSSTSETPINVTGSPQKLDSLFKLLDYAMQFYPQLQSLEDARVWKDGIDWLVATKDAQKDATFELERNPLPFPQK